MAGFFLMEISWFILIYFALSRPCLALNDVDSSLYESTFYRAGRFHLTAKSP